MAKIRKGPIKSTIKFAETRAKKLIEKNRQNKQKIVKT